MQSTIAKWGNSSAVRIPSKVLASTGLKCGDKVSISATLDGTVHISKAPENHVRVQAPRRLTSDALYAIHGIEAPAATEEYWPDDDFVGAEAEAWLS